MQDTQPAAAQIDAPAAHGAGGRRGARRSRGIELLALLLVVAIAARGWIGGAFTSPRAQEWVTVFVAIVVQAMPFVVLGTLLSAAIATLVPERFFAKALPSRPALAVPVAGLAGLALPGCECASVPVAGASEPHP
jgi:uncharacterized membrane protein YraQ (UPF0718 family)